MLTRQTGHFFFEPNGYDRVNDASNEYKEAIKVGFNQYRKIVLLLVWGSAPVALFFFPTLFGVFEAAGRPDRLHPPRRHRLAVHRPRRRACSAWSNCSSTQGRADRRGLGRQGADRPVPQHRAVLQVAAGRCCGANGSTARSRRPTGTSKTPRRLRIGPDRVTGDFAGGWPSSATRRFLCLSYTPSRAAYVAPIRRAAAPN